MKLPTPSTPTCEAFLRIPPFPRARSDLLGTMGGECAVRETSADDVIQALRTARVGSTFWLRAASAPQDCDVLINSKDGQTVARLLTAARRERPGCRPCLRSPTGISSDFPHVSAATDPWTLSESIAHVVCDADDEFALVAALSGCKVTVVGNGRFEDLTDTAALRDVVRRELIDQWSWFSPFDGKPLSPVDAIALLRGWRDLIGRNRDILDVEGVARWKRLTVDPMLWDGTSPVRYSARESQINAPVNGYALAWLSRSNERALKRLHQRQIPVGDIEDGLIRSIGLGANCVPPLSIVVDRLGPHFDPAKPSELEQILESADIGQDYLSRAALLRDTIVQSGIGKYGRDAASLPNCNASAADRRHTVLVTGQVEDDRSVLCGAAGLNNLDLLKRARSLEPDAWIIYRPHPDVEAGHRKGAIPATSVLALADEIDRETPIAGLFVRVDAVHVLTSLAGFEALLRGCKVVTHGVPFYAGWGLTTDLGPVPARRTRQRSIDELVAAALILYPRYVDPVTLLPCEPERVVDRIIADRATITSPLITLRSLQGRLKKYARMVLSA